MSNILGLSGLGMIVAGAGLAAAALFGTTAAIATVLILAGVVLVLVAYAVHVNLERPAPPAPETARTGER